LKYLATVEGKAFEIEINDRGEVWVNGEQRKLDMQTVPGVDLYSILLDNTSYEVFAEEEAGQHRILVQGESFAVDVRDAVGARLRRPPGPACAIGRVEVTAPIPGVLIALRVAPGDSVEAGQVVAVLESMKMENELKAPCGGVVQELRVAGPGAIVDRDQVVMVIGAGTNEQ
jgi:biotin carboxyl carrier protein